jgi:cytochrome P450
VERKLDAELDAAGITSRPWNSVISDSELRELKYLQAVIKEGLRVFPPAGAVVSKAVPEGGDECKGVRLLAGTKVGFCA